MKTFFTPDAHFTLTEDDLVTVIHLGSPLCTPTTFEKARSIAINIGLGGNLPTWDAKNASWEVKCPR